MSLITTISVGVAGVLAGAGLMRARIKYVILVKRLRQVEKICLNFPTIEELATKILTMKIPLDKLPPDVLDSIKNNVNNLNTATSASLPDGITKGNYFG